MYIHFGYYAITPLLERWPKCNITLYWYSSSGDRIIGTANEVLYVERVDQSTDIEFRDSVCLTSVK